MTGQTKDAGWQVGARRTLPLELDQAWELLTRPPWLYQWSGLTVLDISDPAVRSMTAPCVVRVRTAQSLVQLRLLPAASGTTIAFHEDQLPDEHARSRRKNHWTRLLDDLKVRAPAREIAREPQRRAPPGHIASKGRR